MNKEEHALIWFRADLRAQDNTALQVAADSGRTVIACFVVTPEQWREHDMASIKARFIGQNVKILQQVLSNRGIPLKILNVPSFKQLPEALLSLCQLCNVTSLFANHEYGVNEKRRDLCCTSLLEAHGFYSYFFDCMWAL